MNYVAPKSFIAIFCYIGVLVLIALGAIGASGSHDWPFLALIGFGLLAAIAVLLLQVLPVIDPAAAIGIGPAAGPIAPDVVADRARAILNALPDPLLVLGRGREILWANRAAEQQFGGILNGRNLLAVLRHPPLLAAIDAARSNRSDPAIDDDENVTQGEDALSSSAEEGAVEPIRITDGQGSDYVAVVAPLDPGQPGTVQAGEMLILLRDVTGARRLDSLRSDFIANVSHELKTPLATLLGFIETMRGPAKDDTAAQQRFLGIMHDQASRMSRLVSDLLSLSRIELHEHSRPQGQADLARVLGSVADGLGLRAQSRKIAIKLPDPHGLPCIPGEPDELAQVFQNLIDNALKYGREGSTVTVDATIIHDPVQLKTRLPGLRDPKGMVAVSIRDEGEGIAREHLPRLTERFYRVDAARSRDLGGTGLGLAIVKHIVNHHRGSLDIDSIRGKGSVFTVFLPLSD
ncbi:ATP-binding protein [Dongia soli]|uniref:histidine kinase n=1 Tax=Dongia soli TaxID=600628 RepID=A0ABU5E6F7_9PROT|nr:ATP-binding protein [Dongia soli]MDY0881865.1 ATP-binding protein [Dongia soli]